MQVSKEVSNTRGTNRVRRASGASPPWRLLGIAAAAAARAVRVDRTGGGQGAGARGRGCPKVAAVNQRAWTTSSSRPAEGHRTDSAAGGIQTTVQAATSVTDTTGQADKMTGGRAGTTTEPAVCRQKPPRRRPAGRELYSNPTYLELTEGFWRP